MIRVGVDIGGTFTDLALLDESTGEVQVSKVSTTPLDPVQGVLAAVRKVKVPAEQSSYVIHGTTVATNAVVQRNLPLTALITTRGFRDILEIMRGNRPVWGLYDIRWKKPTPIIPRNLRFEASERVDRDGNVVVPLDEDNVREIISQMKKLGVHSVAVCFIFSNVNPSHERRVAELISKEMPETRISLSCEVNPEVREYERTSTVSIDASVKPVVSEYLERLEGALEEIGFNCPLMIMKSSGGMMSSTQAKQIPIYTIESGPAGGVVGAVNLSASITSNNLLAIDMGGTTFKVSLIEDGRPRLKNEGEIEWGVPYRIPMVDLSEIGSGGGSIAWIDKGGILRVGPKSAGAYPGPVCYKTGGTQPTFTDANLVLGRIDPNYFLGGEMKLDLVAATDAIERDIAKPLGMDVLEAAAGVLEISEANMLASMKVSSVERGYDPRDFTTVAYGGAGPLVAANLARELGCPSVVIPEHPGIFSAIGMLYSDMRIDASRTFLKRLDATDMDDLDSVYDELENKVVLALEKDFKGDVTMMRSADMRYVGQNFEISVSIPSGELNEPRRHVIVENFNREHKRLYGHSKIDEPIEMITLRVAAIGITKKPVLKKIGSRTGLEKAKRGNRKVYYEESDSYELTRIFERSLIGAGSEIHGPCVIEDMDTTIAVRPNQTAVVDGYGNIIINLR